QRLKLSVSYEKERRDGTTVTAGRCDPAQRMPRAPFPQIEELRTLTAQWLGQDGANPNRLGDVHVALGGLPASSRIEAVVLSDTVRGAWYYRAGDRVPVTPDPEAEPMDVQLGPDRTSAGLRFRPNRAG